MPNKLSELFGCPEEIYGAYQDFLLDNYPGKEWTNLRVEKLRKEHYFQWAPLRAMSKASLEQYEPTWGHNDLSMEFFKARMEPVNGYPQWDYSIDVEGLNGQRLFVGCISVRLPRGGTEKAIRIAYWVGEPFQQLGIGKKAIEFFRIIFEKAGQYRRIEALVCPENMPSQKILEANGFEQEGLLRGVLNINGEWRDHHLYTFLNSSVDNPPAEVQYQY